MTKRKIIFDVDTGSDDAIAIAATLLSPELEVVGICTGYGVIPVENTTENTLRVVDLFGSSVPVIKGSALPLVKTLNPRRLMGASKVKATDKSGKAVHIHTPYIECLAPSVSKPLKGYAPFWLVKILMESDEKLTLVLVGSFTNFALAFRIEPAIVEHIKEIVIMGGGHEQRNRTSAAESNVYKDPEAAQILFTCGAKITMFPLDATHKSCLDLEDADYFKSLGTTLGEFIAGEIITRIEAYNVLQPLYKPDLAPIHDALCIIYLLDPSVATFVDCRVDVDFSGGACDGRTICDMRTYRFKPNNVKLALDADSEKFSAMMRDILSRPIKK